MKLNPACWPINDDVESEYRFWLQGLRVALGLGTVLALGAGLVIALLPKGDGHPGGEFAWNFWPYLVELAFWLGMFGGLLWGGSKRLGLALAATLPWQQPRCEREATGRFFGQWSAFAAMTGFFLWLAYEVALALGIVPLVTVLAAFMPMATTCAIAAGLFAAVALLHRPRPRSRPASQPTSRR